MSGNDDDGDLDIELLERSSEVWLSITMVRHGERAGNVIKWWELRIDRRSF